MGYYENQAGTGIGVAYHGIRYQKGHGFFGRLISGSIMPLLKQLLPYLGTKVLDTGVNIASDLYNSKDSFKESLKRNAKRTVGEVASDALEKVQKKMRGEGIKRRRKSVKAKAKTPVKRRRSKKKTNIYHLSPTPKRKGIPALEFLRD